MKTVGVNQKVRAYTRAWTACVTGLSMSISGFVVQGRQVTSAPRGPDLTKSSDVEMQPLRAQLERLFEALDYIGQPLLTASQRRSVRDAFETDVVKQADGFHQTLDVRQQRLARSGSLRRHGLSASTDRRRLHPIPAI